MKKIILITPLVALVLLTNCKGEKNREYLETYDHSTTYVNDVLYSKGDYKYSNNHYLTMGIETYYDASGTALSNSLTSISYNEHDDVTRTLIKEDSTTLVDMNYEYKYNDKGYITFLKATGIDDGENIKYQETITYDDLNRPTLEQFYDLSDIQPSLTNENRYTYQDKLIDYATKESYTVSGTSYTLIDKEVNSFDEKGHVINKSVFDSSKEICKYDYSYDNYNCLISVKYTDVETEGSIPVYIYTANYYKHNLNKPSYEFIMGEENISTTITQYDEYDRKKDEFVYADGVETHYVYEYDSLVWE